MLTFTWLWVWALFPLPWIIRQLTPKAASSEQAPLQAPFFDSVQSLINKEPTQTSTRPVVQRILLLLTWVLLLTAASNPQYVGDPVVIRSEARDLMLAVDLSNSMLQEDLRLKGEQVNRLVAVKSVLHDFIDRRDTDRLGLVLFGSQAYLQTPLTFDKETLRSLLDEAQIGIAGPNTAIGDAIGLALKRLKDRPSSSKVLVLLTDGRNTAGAITPQEAAKLAADKDLKIYTVGVGADEVIVPGIFGSRFGSRRHNPSADLDEDTLKEIAALTGGSYFRAKNTESLRRIYELLDQLEPTEANPETFRPVKALYYWPLCVAFLFSLLIPLLQLLDSLHYRLSVSYNTAQPGIVQSLNPKYTAKKGG